MELTSWKAIRQTMMISPTPTPNDIVLVGEIVQVCCGGDIGRASVAKRSGVGQPQSITRGQPQPIT